MTSLGFNAIKMFGDMAKSAGLERSINFHKPHGNTTKLDPWRLRRYGQRLTRVYGIDMSYSFAEKQGVVALQIESIRWPTVIDLRPAMGWRQP